MESFFSLSNLSSPQEIKALLLDQTSNKDAIDSLKAHFPQSAYELTTVHSLQGQTPETFDVLAIVSDSTDLSQHLGQALQILKPNGQLFITLPTTSDASNTEKNLRLAGFEGIQSLVQDNTLFAKAQKANFSTQSQPLKLKKKTKIDLDQLDGETVPEDDLLTSEDLKKPIQPTCTPAGEKKKRACKNCTCGLAEQEVAEAAAAGAGLKSSCGNCALGDAFRCSSCPYKGLPPFKAGDKVLLNDIDDL